MTTASRSRRLVIVSNRLPFAVDTSGGELRFHESTGGLVTGLSSFLASADTGPSAPFASHLWVGWPGATVDDTVKDLVTARSMTEHSSLPIFLSERDMDNFYHGFCNKTIWPLFHYFPSYASYQAEYWEHYRHVNEVFCQALIRELRRDDIVWIHDYHLMLLPKLLKEKTPNLPIGFFLHIPFPSFEIFRLLPGQWRAEILEGLLGADLVGFHTYEYAQHFLQCALRIFGYDHHLGSIQTPGHSVVATTFPMGIDFRKFSTALTVPEVQHQYKDIQALFSGVKVILSVDRLDYTKGILNRLLGFEALLEANVAYRGKVVLVMVVVPSRVAVDHYDQMKKQIEELISNINGKYGTVYWTPIIYQYKYQSFEPLTALYNVSDVALVTPLRDGMNLVAKEYVASQRVPKGVLVLSEWQVQPRNSGRPSSSIRITGKKSPWH
jgi:trehalose 6-phosphate synthase/phosphatase